MAPGFRQATLEDAEQVLAVYAPYCHTPISFEAGPPSVEAMRDRIAKITAQYPWIVCQEGRDIVGYVYASPHHERAAYRWSVDVTVYIRQEMRGRGLGRALYTSLFAMLPLQGYINAYAGITLPNPASVALHQSMGFRLMATYTDVGYKCHRWHTVGYYHKLLQPVPHAPAELRPLADLQSAAEWAAALEAGRSLLKP